MSLVSSHAPEPYITASFFFKKKEGVSHEDFYRHYGTVHANLAISCQAFVYSVRRYVQMHATPACREMGKQLGMEVLDFDACTVFHVRDWDNFVQNMSSKEWMEQIVPDGSSFMHLPGKMMVSWDTVLFG